MTEWLLLGAGLVLVAANALFVAAEFSFITVDRSTVEQQAEAGDRRSAGLLKGLRSLSTQLSGAQLGITVTSLVVGFIAEPSIATLLRGPLGWAGLPDAAAVGVSVTLALLIATAVQMIFGELVPKNWAIAQPLRIARAVAGPQRAFTTVTRPLLRFLNGTANKVLQLLGLEPAEELASARSPQELVSLVDRSELEGTLSASTAQLVARSIEFGARTAADAMTPRPRVRFLASDAPVSEVVVTAAGTGHARFPVTRGGVDDVVGVVHFKHALAVPVDQRGVQTIAQVMVTVPAVPETMELDPLLSLLREKGLQLAVVVDEYGGTAGIVTLEDLVEEIVGEIADEQDVPARRSQQSADGSWSLSGLVRPDEAGDLLGLELPEPEQSDTLGGLLTERLGRLPEVGDAVTMTVPDLAHRDGDGLPRAATVELAVTRLDGRRVDRLQVLRLQADGAAPPDDTTRHGDSPDMAGGTGR